MALAYLRANRYRLGKVPIGRGFAVAAQCDIVQPPERLGSFAELNVLEYAAGRHPIHGQIQLNSQLLKGDQYLPTLIGPIGLAVNAVEVAELITIEIYPDGNAPGPAAEHGIY